MSDFSLFWPIVGTAFLLHDDWIREEEIEKNIKSIVSQTTESIGKERTQKKKKKNVNDREWSKKKYDDTKSDKLWLRWKMGISKLW